MVCGTSESLVTTAALTMVSTGWAGHIGPGLKVTSMTRRIKKNDLTHWFIRDHRELPASYVKSCQKFFDELQATSNKPQATSSKFDKQTNKG